MIIFNAKTGVFKGLFDYKRLKFFVNLLTF